MLENSPHVYIRSSSPVEKWLDKLDGHPNSYRSNKNAKLVDFLYKNLFGSSIRFYHGTLDQPEISDFSTYEMGQNIF